MKKNIKLFFSALVFSFLAIVSTSSCGNSDTATSKESGDSHNEGQKDLQPIDTSAGGRGGADQIGVTTNTSTQQAGSSTAK